MRLVDVLRIGIGCLLISAGLWLFIANLPRWNVVPLFLLGGVGQFLLEWNHWRANWRDPAFFPARAGPVHRVVLVVTFVAIQVVLFALVGASMFPATFGNPEASFFIPLLLILIVASVVYRHFRWGKSNAER